MSAQSEVYDPCLMYKKSIKNQNVDLFNSYIKSNQSSTEGLSDLKLMRARAIASIYGKRSLGNDSLAKEMVTLALEDFDKAIQYNRSKERDISDYQIKRYLSFGKIVDYPQKESDNLIKQKYHTDDDKLGFGMSPSILYNGDLWWGAELSLFQGQRSKEEQKNALGETIYKNSMRLTMNFLSVGYQTNNSDRSQSILLLNLASIKSPINLQPVQLAFLNTKDGNHFGYMPSIGYGNWGFNLSYNYLVLFKKDVDFTNRHFLKLEWNYTFSYKS